MITSSRPSAAMPATSTVGPIWSDGNVAPERRRTRSTPATVRSKPPAHPVKPADQPLTDALNGPTLTPYQGRKSAMNATAAPPTTTRSRVLSCFQSNRISPTSRAPPRPAERANREPSIGRTPASGKRDQRHATRDHCRAGEASQSDRLAEEQRGEQRRENDARLAHRGHLGSRREPERGEHERVRTERRHRSGHCRPGQLFAERVRASPNCDHPHRKEPDGRKHELEIGEVRGGK